MGEFFSPPASKFLETEVLEEIFPVEKIMKFKNQPGTGITRPNGIETERLIEDRGQ
tara:strand:+ start:2042 stop:2209 length:168 start_codon:yes stop_codon:yes gene_type:complete